MQIEMIRKFQKDFVLRGQRPPANCFADWPVYHTLCRRTEALSKSTALLYHLPAEHTALGQRQPLFLCQDPDRAGGLE